VDGFSLPYLHAGNRWALGGGRKSSHLEGATGTCPTDIIHDEAPRNEISDLKHIEI
jgi:hypothetical protein